MSRYNAPVENLAGAELRARTMHNLALAIGGERLCPETPLANGDQEREYGMTLASGIRVRRTFTPNGSVITIEGRESKLPKTQEIARDPSND